MNTIEHLLTCLGEEGAEITQDVAKSLRFGLDDVNCLNPNGPSNRERLIAELNDLIGVADMLVEAGALPKNWRNESMQAAKRMKVRRFMDYARERGTLTGPKNFIAKETTKTEGTK